MIGSISRAFYRVVGEKAAIPVTLGLRNIYILPTGYGLLYLAVLTAMLIGSINYNNNLGFLLTFLLGSLGLTGMLHTYGMLYGLRVALAGATPAFAGDSMDVEIVVPHVDRPRIALRWFFDPHHPVAVTLSPGGAIRVRVPAMTGKRGWFSPPRLCIACDYPVGLFRAWARIHTNLRTVVYPQPVAAPVPMIGSPAKQGGGDTLLRRGTDDFWELGAYQPGDAPRRIHWQAYSRGRGLFVKRFAAQVEAGMMLDMQQIKGNDDEKKLSVLCFHVLQAHRRQLCFGLRMIDQVLPPDSGAAHRDRCLRALALFQRR